MLIILLWENLKGKQLSLNQGQYKLLKKMNHCLVVGLLMAQDPYQVTLLLDQPALPCREAGGSGAKGLLACGPGVED